MRILKRVLFAAAAMTGIAPAAEAVVMHAGAAISVPVDSPWAMGALATLITVVVARALYKRKD